MVKWLIIAVIMIVAFGPILWLMPSPRERRLSSLRQRAYRLGMRVEMRRMPATDVAPEDRVTAGGRPRDTSRDCAVYLHSLSRRLRVLPTGWRVLRHGDGSEALPGWCFEAGRRPDHDRLREMLAVLEDTLTGLPQDVVALECEALAVGAYWLEGPATTPERVDDLAARLGAAATGLVDLDERLQAEAEPRNI